MIQTTKGEIHESLLEKRKGQVDTDTENTEWVEYWFEGELVHRSVHVKLKHAAVSNGDASSF